jgi:hypothetical protein
MPLHVSSTCSHHMVCVMQFWPPDDEHMCSKRVEAWNKLIVKQNCCASSWLITEINTLRCRSAKVASFVFDCIIHLWSYQHIKDVSSEKYIFCLFFGIRAFSYSRMYLSIILLRLECVFLVLYFYVYYYLCNFNYSLLCSLFLCLLLFV